MTLSQEAIKVSRQLGTAKMLQFRSTTIGLAPENALELISTYIRLGYKVQPSKWSDTLWVFSW